MNRHVSESRCLICWPCVVLIVLCRPFDAATYEDEVDDDDVMDEEGRTRLKLKVVNNALCLTSYPASVFFSLH